MTLADLDEVAIGFYWSWYLPVHMRGTEDSENKKKFTGQTRLS